MFSAWLLRLIPQNLINQVPEFANLDFNEFPVTSKQNVDFIALSCGFTVNPCIPALLCKKVFNVSFGNCLTLTFYSFQVTLVIASVDGSAFLIPIPIAYF